MLNIASMVYIQACMNIHYEYACENISLPALWYWVGEQKTLKTLWEDRVKEEISKENGQLVYHRRQILGV